jgi:DNA-directed RNA polymerase subunit omega
VPKRITDEQLLDRAGGRFKLATLLQKRVLELSRGASRLVDTESRDPLEIAMQEIAEGKISLDVQLGKPSTSDDSESSG